MRLTGVFCKWYCYPPSIPDAQETPLSPGTAKDYKQGKRIALFYISKREKRTILDQYPKAEIVNTKYRSYLVGRNDSDPVKLLLQLRGITPQSIRRNRVKLKR